MTNFPLKTAAQLLLALITTLAQACPLPMPAGSVGNTANPPLVAALSSGSVPSTGAYRMLVILADFPDASGTVSQSHFRDTFFGSIPTGSFAEYHREVSYNLLNYTGDVVGLAGGSPLINATASAWVTLPHSKSYYTGDNAGRNVNSFPNNLAGVYRDAITRLYTAGFDFTPYADPSGELTHVVVVFAGLSSRETGNTSDFQPTAYSLGYYFSGGYTLGGFTFRNFTFCPEKEPDGNPATIGVCAHEHGHAFGLPDYYDYSFQSSGAGYYDLMAYGLFAGPYGSRPAHYSAYSKARLGWLAPVVINPADQVSIDLAPVEFSPAAVKVPVSATEYYVIENRRFLGFDDSLALNGLCEGVYVWHIDQAILDAFPFAVNSPASAGGGPHAGIRVVEADGLGELTSAPANYGNCSDAWTVGREFSDASIPPARSWADVPVPMRLRLASSSGSSMSLNFNVDATPAPSLTPGGVQTATPAATPGGASAIVQLRVRGRSISGKIVQPGGPAAGGTARLYLWSGRKLKRVAAIRIRAGGNFSFKVKKAGRYLIKWGIVTSRTVTLR